MVATMDSNQEKLIKDILERLTSIEKKLEQVTGAWWTIKILVSCLFGAILLFNSTRGWFHL
jgi:hypothetical protein